MTQVAGDGAWVGENEGASPGQVRLLMGLTLLDSAGTSILLPLLPFLILYFGGSATIATQLIALYSLAGLIGAPIMGRLSDRFGRGRLLTFSLVGTAIAYLGILLSWTLAGVFAFRLVAGFLAGRGSVVRALATDGVEPGLQGRRIATISTLSSVGTAVGPVIAALVAVAATSNASQYRLTLITAISMTTAALVGALCVFRARAGATVMGPKTAKSTIKLGDLARQLWRPFVLSGLTNFAFGVVVSVTAFLVHRRFAWGAAETGWLLGGMAAGMAIARMLIYPRYVAKLSHRSGLLICLGLAAPALLAVAVSAQSTTFLVALLVFAVAVGIANIIQTTMVSISAPSDARGFALGINQGAVAFGMFVSAAASGPAFDLVGPAAPFIGGAAALLVGWVILAAMRKDR